MNNLALVVQQLLAVGFGSALVIWTITQALRSFVLPRSDRAFLTDITFRGMYRLLTLRFKPQTPFAVKDRLLAMHPPLALFMLPLVWLALITLGYTAIYWGLAPAIGWREALVLSGSSLMTLGFAFENNMPLIILGFSQAALGMMLIALLIGYLPTMYAAFSEREYMVNTLEIVAGSPPSGLEMVRRMHYTQQLYDYDRMMAYWREWQGWFAHIEEQHTTLAAMNFFRSPKPERHWVTAAGAVLDGAAIIASSVQLERSTSSGLVIRAGFLSLRTIADYFDIDYNPDPAPSDPISIKREEFEAVLDDLKSYGIPLNTDRDYCWDHFAGWRVNYDEVLLALAYITYAPYAPWSSDRAREWRPEDIPPTPRSILEGIRTPVSDLTPPPSATVEEQQA